MTLSGIPFCPGGSSPAGGEMDRLRPLDHITVASDLRVGTIRACPVIDCRETVDDRNRGAGASVHPLWTASSTGSRSLTPWAGVRATGPWSSRSAARGPAAARVAKPGKSTALAGPPNARPTAADPDLQRHTPSRDGTVGGLGSWSSPRSAPWAPASPAAARHGRTMRRCRDEPRDGQPQTRG